LKNRTHLFLASYPASRGEITLALRVAHDLYEQGDRIVFLIYESDSKIFSGKPYEIVLLDSFTPPLDNHLTKIVQSYKPDSLILVDLMSNSLWLHPRNDGKWFLDQQMVPVLAMDIHNVGGNNLRADVFLDREWEMGPLTSIPKGRILPVPYISAHLADVYDCLLPPVQVSEDQKKQIRSELGISNSEKFILMVSANWQSASTWDDIHGRRISMFVPNLLTYYISRIDSRVKVVHIGPQKFYVHKNLTERYLWLEQVDQLRFQALLASADLFVTPNIIGTTLSSVLTVGIPMVVVRNSIRARSTDEVISKLSAKPSEELMNWMQFGIPIYPFRAWPLGLYKLTSRSLENNPFCETFIDTELLKEEEFIEACRKMLYDNQAREAILQRQKNYNEMVRKLPGGADLINQHLAKL
jgi:hypothetical protein